MYEPLIGYPEDDPAWLRLAGLSDDLHDIIGELVGECPDLPNGDGSLCFDLAVRLIEKGHVKQ